MKKISCAFITKGEPSLADAIASVRPHVDEVVLVDTGVLRMQQIEQLGVDVYRHCTEYTDEHGLNHFAKARQISFDLATGDAVMWLDSDDKLAGGHLLRPVVESTPNDKPALIKLPYEYIVNEQGVCTTLQSRERIVMPPQAFEWHRRVHETLDPLSAPINVTLETPPALRVIHCRKVPQDHARNIRLCRMCLAEDPGDNRARFFLGLALFDAGDHAGAERELATYAEDTEANADERIMALVRLAWLALGRTDPQASLKYAMAAHEAKPWDICCFAVARAHHGIANLAYGQDEANAWAQALWWALAGLATEPTAAPLWQSPLDREGVIHCTISKALARHGNIEAALESVGKALAVLPGDAEMQADQYTYRAVIAAKQVAMGQANAAQVLQQAERALKEGVLSRTKVEQVRHQVQAGPRPKAPGELSIVFACGQAVEPWNPDLMHQRGIGGSEQAVVYMAEHLAMRGHHVRVYANCGPQPRIFSRVEYFPTPMLPAAGGCDVLVGWRDGSAMEMVQAEARLLWAHDTSLANVNEWRWHLADRVLCLSGWHRECLKRAHPEMPAEKLWLTRNGIELSNFATPTDRDPAKAVFSSSPARGLGVLLDLWPDIRTRAVDLGATNPSLHVYYGFESTEAMAKAQGNTKLLGMIATWRKRMAAMADQGVVAHGRVPPRVLAAEMLSAGAWLYPSWDEYAGDSQWCETSCLHPDSRIAVPGDHRGGPPTVRIADLVGKSGFPVYAYDAEANRFKLATCNRVWQTKIADEMVALDLDSGSSLRVTPDHLVMNYDREWVQAGDLKPGDRVLALNYRYNVAIQDGNGDWTNEHRLVGEWMKGRTLESNEHVDHLDPERLDNSVGMLQVLSASEHSSKTHRGKRIRSDHNARRVDGFKAWAAANRPTLQASNAKAGSALWRKLQAMPAEEREAWLKARGQASGAARCARAAADPAYAAARSEQGRAAANKRATDHVARMATDPAYASAYLADRQRVSRLANAARWGSGNHKVVAVRRIPGGPVFDMEVAGMHNFVADEVVVHNCIGAMEAQAAGLRIVTLAAGALPETVGTAGVLIDDDPRSGAGREAFVQVSAQALAQDPFDAKASVTFGAPGEPPPVLRGWDTRIWMQKRATERFDWAPVAEAWEALMHETLRK